MRSIAVIALAVFAAACSDDAGTEPADRYADVEDARVRIVAGDGQSAPVAAPGRSALVAPVAARPAAVEDQYDLFPAVLEVEVSDADGPSASITAAINAAVVPAGTDVHWLAREEGCGAPVGQTTSTDSAGRARNRWIRGTKAQECHLDVCRILSDGGLACDTTFTAVQLPGPVADFVIDDGVPGTPPWDLTYTEGDTIDLRVHITGGWDGYGNSISTEQIHAYDDVAWEWCRTDCPYVPEGTGWKTEVPAVPPTGPDSTWAQLVVWVGGVMKWSDVTIYRRQ